MRAMLFLVVIIFVVNFAKGQNHYSTLFYSSRDGNQEVCIQHLVSEQPINLTNNPAKDNCPMLSPDGKYFFFTSTRTENGDIYWVDAIIIKDLREEVFNTDMNLKKNE